MDEFDVEDQNSDELFSFGRKVKIDLADMDYVSWRDSLKKDAEVLELLTLLVGDITPEHDSKLQELFRVIDNKITHPINEGNKKLIIFTAFADTAGYLYDNVSRYVKDRYGLNTAMVSGSVEGRTTCPKLRADLNTVLTCFSPISKDKELLMPGDKTEIDVLIATDCISEGQNLQDCDYLINYDIHWNPVRIIQRFGRIDRIGSRNKVIYIEGDNLEVLKLLQETYLGKIKMIYIDPPYNTGSDLVYNDVNFIGQITVVGNPRGRDYGGVARMHDYLFVYKKSPEAVINLIEDSENSFKMFDSLGGFELRELAFENRMGRKMELINNTTKTLKNDLSVEIKQGSKLSIAAACFSIYAFQELKEQLSQIEQLRFIFTSPTFVTEKAKKERREFYIPRLTRERSLYGTEFEIKLRNELTQKAIARECAEWIRQKVTFKSNVSDKSIQGQIVVDSVGYTPINNFTTVELGCEKGNVISTTIVKDESLARTLLADFNEIWNDSKVLQVVTDEVIDSITAAYNENSPDFIYFVTLYNIFNLNKIDCFPYLLPFSLRI